MSRLSVTLGNTTLTNPIIPASGTFGYGHDHAPFYDLNILGAISCKGTTEKPRYGNPLPRIAETEGGMLNAVGLQNPGIDVVLSEELPRLRAFYKKPVMLNLSGFSLAEFSRLAEKAGDSEHVDLLEVNVSCPNVRGGGTHFGSTAKDAAAVTRAVRAKTEKPVFIKLSPNVANVGEIARACEEEGADGISVMNTLVGMRIDVASRRPVLANKTGGLSGPAVFPVAVRVVHEVFCAVHIPVIGMGGVSSARDVIEMMMAGATAVQVGTANLVNPVACRDIIEELPRTMDLLQIEKLPDIIGCAAR